MNKRGECTLTIGNIIFLLAMIPMFVQSQYPAKITSAIFFSVLAAFTAVYFENKVYSTAFITGVTSILWVLAFLQI